MIENKILGFILWVVIYAAMIGLLILLSTVLIPIIGMGMLVVVIIWCILMVYVLTFSPIGRL